MNSDNAKVIGGLKDILKDTDSFRLILISLKMLRCSRIRLTILIIIAVILVIPLGYVGFGEDTVTIAMKIVDMSNSIIIPVFSVLFMGYALFQALVGGSTLKRMLIEEIEDKSMFKTYNLFFYGITIYNLFIIILNYFLLIVFQSVPKNWSIPFFGQIFNNILASALLLIYVIINIYALFEVKSFLYNIYQCFSMNAYATIVSEIRKENDMSKKIGF